MKDDRLDVNKQAKQDIAPLHMACIHKNILKYLLEDARVCINIKKDDKTLLYMSASLDINFDETIHVNWKIFGPLFQNKERKYGERYN